MRAAWALLAALVCAPASPGQGATIDVRALELVAPADVAVGDEVLCIARVDAPGAAAVVGDVDFGVAWASEGPVERAAAGGTTFTWSLIPLTAGELALPEVELEVGGERVVFGAPAGGMPVIASPRAAQDETVWSLPAFREPAVDAGIGPRLLPLGLVLLFGLLCAGYGAWQLVRGGRRGSATGPEPAPGPSERLAALDSGADPLGTAAALGPLVRRLVDDAAGEDRSALTDGEWLAAAPTAAGLTDDERDRLTELLAASDGARYGGRAPGVFALKDQLAAARALAGRLGAGPGLDGSAEGQP